MTDTKKPRGFAALTPAERKRISSLGGRAATERGTAHRWNSETAKEAGRLGGEASRISRNNPPSV